ncbi:hypothetical protein Droror1_Dr00020522 [Drosera rotundifolia]
MQTSQESQSSDKVHMMYKQPAPDLSPYWPSRRVPCTVTIPDNSHVEDMAIQVYNEPFFTLESYPATKGFVICDSPSVISHSSSRTTLSPQGSHSCITDPHVSSEITYGSPVSASSGVVDDEYELRNKLRELEISLLEQGNPTNSYFCTFDGGMVDEVGAMVRGNSMMEVISRMDIKQLLVLCAQTAFDDDILATSTLMEVLGQKVSVSGTPIERLAAYMLEGLRARLEYSGYTIYKKLRCDQPTEKEELLSYMHMISAVCPFYDFGYNSSNITIQEAMENEGRIHIIDFQISMGSQWIPLIESLARRPGGPPYIRITGVDDENSAYVRGGGLQLIGDKLVQVAESCEVPFQFHAAAMSGSQVKREHLRFWPGEAVAVNFPYLLHHMPDESVNTINHRDRLIRLVKSLNPKVVTLMEQETNTNTASFMHRFIETLDYYNAMFESVDVAIPRDNKKRINAEMNCLARDVVNVIACEGAERIERHELLGKWKARFMMAGFKPWPLSPRATNAVKTAISKYDENYRVRESDGALYLCWKQRNLASSSAWR